MQHLRHYKLYAIWYHGSKPIYLSNLPYKLTGYQALDQKVEKRSPTLNRDAVYTQHSRLERLPTYLTVHMVRFAWRRDIAKKAKIMVCFQRHHLWCQLD